MSKLALAAVVLAATTLAGCAGSPRSDLGQYGYYVNGVYVAENSTDEAFWDRFNFNPRNTY